MPTIKYNRLEDFLGSVDPSNPPGFYLICGEAFLIKQAFNTLTNFLLKDQNREFGLEVLEGSSTAMGDIVEQTTTFSFIVPQKVIAVKNAPLFSSGATSGEIFYSKTDMDLLAGLIEKGIPDNHTLVMTSSNLDRRKKVFKIIETHGTIIDCVVSAGVRKADMDEQRVVLQEICRNLMAASKKRMDAPAFNTLVDQTGFNPERFARNIEKLVAYTGANPVIGLDDIKAVVIRDKKDPIFSLTNAIQEKDAAKALGVLSSLVDDGFHPLQILKSLENQVRKLLMIKSFCRSSLKIQNPHHFKQMNYNGFTNGVMPIILAHDQKVKKAVEERDLFLTPPKISGTKKTGTKKIGKEKKIPIPPDLLLAPNPKSPYPVFLIFQHSENFSLNQLKNAMIALGDLDYQLKSSPIDALTGIENFIINLSLKGR